MKLMTLNIWGGHVLEPLLDFISRYQDVDIFCLQEVYHEASKVSTDEDRTLTLNIFNKIQDLLPQHNNFFRPILNNTYGIGMFVKKDITVVKEAEAPIFDNPNYSGIGPAHPRILQWIECQRGEKSYSIVNVHGLWNGKGKTDTPDRITQSERIKLLMDQLPSPKILCGDFNLRPDSHSMSILEEGMINLVKTHNITSTRTSYYPKKERFADYILVSDDVEVKHFEVLPDEVSDHAALLLEYT